MKIKLKLVDPKKIKRDIIKELDSEVRKRFIATRIAESTESSARNIILKNLNASPTTAEILSGGPLLGELGIPEYSVQYFSNIFTQILNSVKVNIKLKSLSTKHGIQMTVSFDSDFSAYKGMGTYETEKGQTIPWFEWLTELGDRVIVRNFDAEGGHPKQSRTGDMIMVKGGGWRVPPQHAGSPGDNFITKAVDNSLPEITNDIIQKMKRGF